MSRLARIRDMVLGAVSVMVCFAMPLSAEVLSSYYTTISANDRVNSRGVPLSDFGAMLQQDRANYHRFGRPDPGDQSDGFFMVAEMRASIPALFARRPDKRDAGYWQIQADSPYDIGIVVFICGGGGRVTHIAVDPADGDGYAGC